MTVKFKFWRCQRCFCNKSRVIESYTDGGTGPWCIASNDRMVAVLCHSKKNALVYNINGQLMFKYGGVDLHVGRLEQPCSVTIELSNTFIILDGVQKKSLFLVSNMGKHVRNINLEDN